MRSIVLDALLVLALATGACGAADNEHDRTTIRDTVLGVQLRWSTLPVMQGAMLCDDEALARRTLASVAAGPNRIEFVLTLIPIRRDDGSVATPAGYEVDSGQLVKRMGQLVLPLGASSGVPSEDYPELSESIRNALLSDYVETVSAQFPDTRSLEAAISTSPVCDSLDPALRPILKQRGIHPRCKPTPSEHAIPSDGARPAQTHDCNGDDSMPRPLRPAGCAPSAPSNSHESTSPTQ
jgi:hypothetical protein